MICKYCNAQIDNNERICPNCGKLLQNKKSGLIIALAIAVACIIAVLFVFGYMGIRGKLWFQRDSFDNQQDANQDDIAVNDVASENDSKIYRVISDEKLSEKDMDVLVYNLQRRAEEYTTEATVTMIDKNSEWYIEISMPDVDGNTYDDGTKLFADGTGKYVGEQISIVLDGEVISSPTVQCAITGGEAVISSVDSYEEAAKAGKF
jgi:preprotein translocase subunit SecD/predicted nucleic acid-binding Zn ribbon protein